MAITWVEMVDGGTLTATSSPFYTCPPNTTAVIQAVSVNNPTAGAVVVNIYRVPTGQTVGPSYKIATRTAPSGGTVQFPECVNHKLISGSAIYADGNGCFLNASGSQNVPNT